MIPVRLLFCGLMEYKMCNDFDDIGPMKSKLAKNLFILCCCKVATMPRESQPKAGCIGIQLRCRNAGQCFIPC